MAKLTDHEATLVLRLLSANHRSLGGELAEQLAEAMGLTVDELHDRFEEARTAPPIRAMAPL